MRVMVTGAAGFVGIHFVDALKRTFGASVEVLLTALSGERHPVLGVLEAMDVTDRGDIDKTVAAFAPTHVMHLAGIAASPTATDSPDNAWAVHLDGALNLSRSIMTHAPDAWLLHVGSGMAYGSSAKVGTPLDENALIAPFDEYSASKAAADLALGALAGQGLKCLRLRPFNHTGSGQTSAFVAPSFALQFARIEAGLADPIVMVGNLDAQRDFLDVRDVAQAYVSLIEHSETLSSGEIFNIASGLPFRVQDIFDHFLAHCRVDVKVETDPARLRPSDLPFLVGDATKLRQTVGWKPSISLDEMLNQVLEDCRTRVTNG